MSDDPNQRRTIHIRIRDLRRERSLTQEELAAALGLSRQSINAMEAGRNLPSLPVAMQIASFFSVPVHAIFDPADEPKSVMTPWSPLRDMREALDELMDESVSWGSPASVAPPVNVYETESAVEVELRLPGYAKNEISIEVGEDFVTVSSEASDDASQEFFHREFFRQAFSRTISLPVPVESDQAEAAMQAGILRLSLPKVVERKPKTSRISIKSDE